MIRRRAKSNRRLEECEGVAIRRPSYRMLAMVLVLLSGCGGYWYGRQAPSLDLRALTVWADQFFPIKSVEINDLHKVSRGEVLAALNLDGGGGLLSADTTKLKHSLESHPWIRRAEVQRVFPDTLAVEVKEREPAAVLRVGTREVLLGEDGAVIAEAGEGTFEGFPILTGIDYAQVVSKNSDTTERVIAGIGLASLLSAVGANRMEVDLRTPGDMVAYYDGLRIRFGEGAFEDKVVRYLRLAERGFKRAGAIDEFGQTLERGQPGPGAAELPGRGSSETSKESQVEVDLRFQDQIIVRDKGGKRAWPEKTKSS
jgi:cell division septal protein FtsQ